jgi:Domain of unknown function (DUF4389)
MGDPEAPAPPPPPEAPPPASAAPGPDALRLDIDRQEEYTRLLPLIKWLLIIPHLFVLLFLGIGLLFVGLFAFFAVIITGRFPRGAFDYILGVYRWSLRVNAYSLFMTDRYPPFSLQDDADYPARLQLDYPESVERWRPLVAWILIIPYAILTHLINIVAAFCTLFAFFAILFTKRYPEGLFEIVLIAARWNARAIAYAHFALTKYPEFAWR